MTWIKTPDGGTISIVEARSALNAGRARLTELRGYDNPSSAQRSELAELETEVRQTELSLVRAAADAGDLTPVAVGEPVRTNGASIDDTLNGRRGVSERDKAQRVVEAAHRSGHLPDHAAEAVERLVTDDNPAERGVAARWAVATGDPAYLRAFTQLLANPERGHLTWSPEEAAAFRTAELLRSEMRAMSLTDANGGYMVPLTLDPAIILTSAGSINPLRRISRTVQTATDQWTGVTSAGVTAEWKSEAAEAADASPTVDDAPIPVHFGDAFVPYSFEVGMDAANFLPELQKLLVDAADQLQATAFTTGSGTGQPKGLITALAGSASEVAPTVAETFSAADVYKVLEAVPPRFRANAQWMANLSVLDLIDQFETTNGARKFPSLDDDRLLRRPVNENSNMDGTWSAAATADNFALVAGDFRNFVIVDRIGTTLELIPNLVGANRRPTGQRGALLWFRTGSDCVNVNAFAVLNIETTA